MTLTELNETAEALGVRIGAAEDIDDILCALKEYAPLKGGVRTLCHNGFIEAIVAQDDFRSAFMWAFLDLLKKGHRTEFATSFANELKSVMFLRSEEP